MKTNDDELVDAMAAVSAAYDVEVGVETEWGDVFSTTLGQLVDDNQECMDAGAWFALARLANSDDPITVDCGPMRVTG